MAAPPRSKINLWEEISCVLNLFNCMFPFAAGMQLIHVDKIELESVVPNSYPETFINVRGQWLSEQEQGSVTNLAEWICSASSFQAACWRTALITPSPTTLWPLSSGCPAAAWSRTWPPSLCRSSPPSTWREQTAGRAWGWSARRRPSGTSGEVRGEKWG